MAKKQNAVAKHYRQGDILLQEIDKVPSNAVKNVRNGSIVLGEGETAGHRHEILQTEGVESYSNDGFLYLSVEQDTELVHPEHAKIELAPGNYEVIRQTEFQRREFVRVQD